MKFPFDLTGHNLIKDFPGFIGTKIAREVLVCQEPDHLEYYSTKLNKWFSLHYYPSLNGVSLYIQDITKLKTKELELKKLADLVEYSKGLVIIVDLDFKITYANESARLKLGFTSEDISNSLSAFEFLPDITLDKMKREESDLFSEGKWVGETILKTRYGSLFPVAEVAMIHKNTEGIPQYLSFGFLDISVQKEAEANALKLNSELRNLSIHLQNVIEQDRTNLAKEIHDQFSQNLVALSMNAAWLKNKFKDNIQAYEVLEEQMNIAIEIINTSRTIFNNLHPSMLEELGLEAAIRWYATTTLKNTSIQFNLQSNNNTQKLSREVSLGLFRIFQECLSNSLKYANATKISTEIFFNGTTVSLYIADNGIGFNKEKVDITNSHGLLAIRERVLSLKGELLIDAVPGKGTKIDVRVPVNNK